MVVLLTWVTMATAFAVGPGSVPPRPPESRVQDCRPRAQLVQFSTEMLDALRFVIRQPGVDAPPDSSYKQQGPTVSTIVFCASLPALLRPPFCSTSEPKEEEPKPSEDASKPRE